MTNIYLEFFKFIMRIIGAYGIIQVFAQDIGLPSGCKQLKLMHNIYTQVFIFTCSAYAVTDDLIQSFIGTTIYFLLKYIYSKNKTTNSCFPDKCEVMKCE